MKRKFRLERKKFHDIVYCKEQKCFDKEMQVLLIVNNNVEYDHLYINRNVRC